MNPSEATQQNLMQQIAVRLRDTPYVLKGGAALMLTRSLARHSTDLDFDSGKKLNLEGRIREGVKAAGVELTRLKAVKDTDTVQRYKLHYLDPSSGETTILKIETSFRQAPKPEAVEVVNDIQTYSVGYIFDQKMKATEKRTVARDLFDITHLIKTQGDQLSSEQISKADRFSQDIDALASLFAASFETDENLSKITTVEETVLALREAVEELQQGMSLQPAPNAPGQASVEARQQFMQKVGEPAIHSFIRSQGQTEGSISTASTENYQYQMDNKTGSISIFAKDDRGHLTPENMQEKDLLEIAQIAQQQEKLNPSNPTYSQRENLKPFSY